MLGAAKNHIFGQRTKSRKRILVGPGGSERLPAHAQDGDGIIAGQILQIQEFDDMGRVR